MSCSYSPEPSSKRSPYSDKFNLTVFLPAQIQSPNTTKASASYSALTFSSETTTMKSTTWYEITINPTADSASTFSTSETTTGTLAAESTAVSWLSVVLVFTGVGLFLSGLMGFICLCHFNSSDDLLTEVNYSSCQVETTSLLTSSVCSKKHG
ncbi:uncharacterized protein [Chanodichthys erythropterus]|uniref:uncharacterized protein n=1 Tax=Chanodichthys erythropterus TaxID=933992 RepID=UPI00351EE270